MASPHFPNYLRSHRRRLALSQEDVAYLLGVESGTKVSRHERVARQPEFETVLAYEVIFQRPAKELFSGLYEQIEDEVAARAKILARKLDCRKSSPNKVRKFQVLANLAELPTKRIFK